jgi:hypothetical protein
MLKYTELKTGITVINKKIAANINCDLFKVFRNF